jgi:predicted pyridoxine 5'-phosphate oxidase superfamily flavin-nucleotide-binding protein
MIRLTEEMRAAIDTALADGVPIAVAAVDAEGQPTITFRGSTLALDEERLALWARNPGGGLVRAIAANPKVALLYRNPATRTAYLFHGRAHVTDDAALAEQIYDRSPEPERTRDPERLGVAIVVELDCVIQRGEVLMERD